MTRRGHSLIELTIVVMLVATIAVIAVPRYTRSLERYRVDAAARRVVADLAYARTQARLVGQSRTVTFNLAKSAYTISDVRGLRDDGGPYEVVIADEPYSASIQSVALGEPTDLDDDPAVVQFNGYG
ncbi:MAG: prepilin-type N-terminal cleavage/methylation domain-containing protein, partial [Phycisphaerae bacterium]|nr:prepilin-type N-terminal cleavage/methylation domain-containing protein [Phycisphaerae bacterium]